MIFCVDFDGTLVENAWPEIGEPKWSIVNKVKEIQSKGHIVILWTCRENENLKKALDFCKEKLDLTFDFTNENVPALNEEFGNDCRKLGADYYIDDKNLSLSDFESLNI